MEQVAGQNVAGNWSPAAREGESSDGAGREGERKSERSDGRREGERKREKFYLEGVQMTKKFQDPIAISLFIFFKTKRHVKL